MWRSTHYGYIFNRLSLYPSKGYSRSLYSTLGLPRWSRDKAFTRQCRSHRILGSGRSPGEGNGYPLHIGYLLLPIASLLMNINLFLVVSSINTFVISSFALIYAQSFFIDCAIIGTVNCFYLKLLIHMKLTLMCIRGWSFNFFLYFSTNVMMPWVEQFHYGVP